MSELLKQQLLSVKAERCLDGFYGVSTSKYQQLADLVTVGPYEEDQLYAPAVRAFLADPQQVYVILFGRNELQHGNLPSVLQYALESTGSPRNIVYVDGNSSDQSIAYAESMGITALRRSDLLDSLVRKRLAEVLVLEQESVERQNMLGEVPLRKGAEVLNIQRFILTQSLQGQAPRYLLYIDADLQSIPGGPLTHQLTPQQIYHPIQQLACAILHLNAQHSEGTEHWAVYTGSGDRNNEPLFVLPNLLEVEAHSPFLDEEQQQIAHAFFLTPSHLVHPLTGEIIVRSSVELNIMGATRHGMEAGRVLCITGLQFDMQRSLGLPETSLPLIGNVRRGTALRLDELQTEEKDWWLVCAIRPQFTYAIVRYCIHHRKLPHQLQLDDYIQINRWLRTIQHSAILDRQTQTRIFKDSLMERVIPPILLLQQEGILKI